MEELIIPEDYNILSYYTSEINGNTKEIEDLPMGFKRDNKNIIGYTITDITDKFSCIGDGIVQDGKDEPKSWLPQQGIFGKGKYFYEYNYKYAINNAKSKKLDIVGAVISPKNVLDFTDGSVINIINEQQKQFCQYIQELKSLCIQKMCMLKNKKSNTYREYENTLNRLNDNNINITDFINYLDKLGKENKKYKYDAIRYISHETNQFLGIPIYQSTILYVRNVKSIVEYFNPLNPGTINMIQRMYFGDGYKTKKTSK